MATSNWDKYKLLMWKNWKQQWAHKPETLNELIVPLIFTGALLIVRGIINIEHYRTVTRYSPVPLDQISMHDISLDTPIDWDFVYAPKNPFLDILIQKSAERLNCTFTGIENIEDLGNHISERNSIAGILFDESYKSLQELPDKLNFILKFPSEMRSMDRYNPLLNNWQTDLEFPKFALGGPRDKSFDNGGPVSGYITEGFVQVQNMISRVFIEEKTGQTVPEVKLQRYPYPQYVKDIFSLLIERAFPLIIIHCFAFNILNMVKGIVAEKMIKETLKIMGIPAWIHWSAWFSKAMPLFVVALSIMVLMFKTIGGADCIFKHSSWTIMWVFFFLYSICTLMFGFMLSSIFTNIKKAVSITLVLYFWLYVPYSFEFQQIGLLLLSCLSLNASMGYGLEMFLRWEKLGVGLQWNNLFSVIDGDERGLTAGHTFLMLIFNSCLYLTVALYLEKVNPGKFGVAERWYFPFSINFWKGTKARNNDCESQVSLVNNDNFEEEPIGKNLGIQIKGLRKEFNSKKVAVEGASLNLFEDEITVLLGNNDSGKTTLLSMLNGMIPATSGTAELYGKDISRDIEDLRKTLGICPKHNILYDDLTVREHIVFYCRLKGFSDNECEMEVQKYVKVLEMEDYINTPSVNLSDGLKRKLSIGITFCGGSKVILCDEPTSSLEPNARLDVWKLLKSEKEGRTILLSTHFVDEADTLGDRIAIMSGGDLHCNGSPYFLKNKFGVGYRLVCVKADDCNPDNVTELISKYVPEVIVSDIGTELSYQISEKSANVFPNLCKALEEQSMKLGIKSFGISSATLNDVLMRVGNDPNESTDTLQERDEESVQNESIALLKGFKLRMNQFLAIIKNKMLSFLRSWFLMSQLFPNTFVILLVVIASRGMFDSTETLPNRELSLNNYIETVTVLETHNSVAENSFEFRIADEYKKYITRLSDSNSLDAINDDIQNHLLELGTASLKRVDAEYIVGASVASDGITAWFNNQPYHGIPISVNTVYNAILRAAGCTDCEISVTNFPLPFTKESNIEMLRTGNNFGFQLALCIGSIMSVMGAFFIQFYIRDRTSGAKLLHFMSGVNAVTYWFATLISDYFVQLIITIVMTVGLATFQIDGYATAAELGRLFTLLIFFGCAMFSIDFLMSLYFKVPVLGFFGMLFFNLLTGVGLFMISFLMKAVSDDSRKVAEVFRYFFMVFPHFALLDGICNLHTVQVMRLTCSNENPCEESTNYFSWTDGISANLTYMLFVTICGMIGLIMLETGYFKKKVDFKKLPVSNNGSDDEDVKAEKDRIDNMTISEISSKNFVTQRISKQYGEIKAVNQLSFSVEHNECFGLLGINDSGKTSTIKMLTGDESVTHGETWVSGFNLEKDKVLAFQNMGYCPQSDDVLSGKITGREILRLFAVLRGIPNNKINTICKNLVTQLNLKKHIKKEINNYNTTTKRKLYTAIALIGNQSVVYLDEPTTGMDPASKRLIFDTVRKQRNSGKSIILSTRSVDECEVLSTKLSVMVNGEFKCLGSPQHLKNRFNLGYTLTIRIGKCEQLSEESERITNFVVTNFKDAYLKEDNQTILTYYIPNTHGRLLSEMFSIMENRKESVNIRDYSLNQTALGEIFFTLTKEGGAS